MRDPHLRSKILGLLNASPLTVAQLGDLLGLKTDNLGRLLRRMESEGLVHRSSEAITTHGHKTPVWAASEQRQLTEAEAQEEAAAFRLICEQEHPGALNWPSPSTRRLTEAEALNDAVRLVLLDGFPVPVNWVCDPPVITMTDELAEVMQSAIVHVIDGYASEDFGTPVYDHTLARLNPATEHEIGDEVHVYDGGARGPYVGLGIVTGTWREDPELAAGEYRVRLPGQDDQYDGHRGATYESDELRATAREMEEAR